MPWERKKKVNVLEFNGMGAKKKAAYIQVQLCKEGALCSPLLTAL